MKFSTTGRVLLPVLLLVSSLVYAEGSSTDEIAKYRELLADGNPAELWEMRGEELWRAKAGPSAASLEECDLGKGEGVIAGTYVELPRYFKDTGKVMDLEQRLIHCRMTLQGLSFAEATKNHFGSAGNPSDIEAIVTYIVAQSRGMKIKPSLSHAEEKKAYEIGKRFFYYRAGSHDFSCATCHSADSKRIRLQELPNITKPADAQLAFGAWPAYRVSQGEVRSMQHRLTDCLRQQRFPEPVYGSDLVTAITLFLAKSAEGGVYNAPAIKR